MPRYQTASHRASGANSESSPAPKGCVSSGRSNERALCPPSGLTIAAATKPTSHTSRRLARNAVSASRSAASTRGLSIACPAMVIASFWTDHRNTITAIGTILFSFALAHLIDRAIQHRGARLAQVIPGSLSPTASTRLRLIRRLVYVAIIVIGVMLALVQFPSVKRVATGVLASSAVLGLVVGFAARQTLANVVAGVLLAITQPIRIGDLVTFEDETGVIEDVRLTYTYVRTDDGRRIIIPNERLAQNTVQNHTIVDPRVRVEASVWIPREVDAIHAVSVLRGDDVDVSIAEIDKDAVRLVAGTWARKASERGPIAAGLRASCLERLRSAGLSSAVAE